MLELREEELDQLFKQAISLHPSEDELGLFHDGVTDAVASARIMAHLRQCADCRESFEAMRHILATYHEVEVPEESLMQLKSLIASTRPKQEQVMKFGALIGLVLYALDRQGRRQKISLRLGGAHAAGEEIYKGGFDGETLTWRIERDECDDFTVLFTSNRLDWKDYQLNIQIGQNVRAAVLKPVDERLLGAGFVITRDERILLGEGDEMKIKSVSPPEITQT